jgi:hypothetical protein
MVAGNWLNQDGLYLQFGTQKAVPEVGGDYLMYGDTRVAEFYIPLAQTTFGSPTTGTNVFTFGVPNGFTSNTLPQGPGSAGVVSLTTLLPLQVTAPATGSSIVQTQVWCDGVDVETLITANAGSTGTATGLSGVGLVYYNPTSTVYVQAAPNAGTQLLGATSNAQMTQGNKWTFWPVASSAAMTPFPTTTPPTGGNWGGNFPVLTGAPTVPQLTSPSNPSGFPEWAYVAAWGTGGNGVYTGTSAAGLLRFRVRYNIYGIISN